MSEDARQFAACAGAATAAAGMTVISGGARGIDQEAMRAAVSAGGNALGVLADSLERAIRERETQELMEYGSLCVITPYSPSQPFSVANAMGRNKIIYALADFALVVDSDFEKGGTWSGATENLRQGFVPLFVRESPGSGPGNQQLIRRGAVPLTLAEISSEGALTELMDGKLRARIGLHDTAQPDERLSRLVEYLQQPRRISEISEALGLSKVATRELIKQALATGQIVRVNERPVTYQAGDKVSSSDLFGSGEP
jgi:predicted Rossmann fold nucleotide-binding protein DprA/Smf involved in DNA uptake